MADREQVQGPLSTVVTDPDTPSQTPAAPLSGPYKMTGGGKGVVPTITPTAGMVLNEESNKSILANMQKMLNEYESPKKGLDDALMKAHAWTMYNKTPAFQQIQQQEEQDRTNKYNIAQNMATIQAMSGQSKNLADYWNQPVNAAGSQIAQPTGTVAGDQGMTRFQKTAAGAPEVIRNQAESLYNRGYVDQALQKLADYEIKGKPSDVKLSEYIQSLPADSAARTLLERQTYKDAFGKQVRIVNGQEVPYTIDPYAKAQPTSAPQTGTGKISLDNLTSPQGTRNVPGAGPGVHGGIDLKAASGTPVNAFAPGKVLSAGDANDGYGTKVVVQHPDGTTGIYAHLSNTNLKPGDTVSVDTPLGASGQTGNATGPHLHAEVRDANGNPIDAKTYYAKAPSQQKPTTLGGLLPESTEGVKAIAGDYERSQAAFDKIRGELGTQVMSENAVPENVGRALEVLKTAKVGPGTSMNQALLELKGVVKTLSPEEINTLNKVKTLDQTQKQLLAAGVKSAFGGQLSDKESDRYIASLFKIDDPKQFIQASLEMIKANAIYKQQAYKFMQTHPHNSAEEFEKWKNDGKTYSEIMRKEAPFAYKLASGSSPAAAGPRKVVKFGELGTQQGTK